MILQPIDYVVYSWLALALLSAAYVAFDQFRHNPEATVMKLGFVLVTFVHRATRTALVRAGRQGAVARHARGVRCSALETGRWLHRARLLIFQALFMRATMGGTYWENVKRSFLPEFLSMNVMMAGMAPVMTWMMMGRDMRAMWPGELLFWFAMSLGIIAGFLLAYPINVWLVAQQMKHGLMTVRPPQRADEGAAQQSMKEEGPHAGHDMSGMAPTQPESVPSGMKAATPERPMSHGKRTVTRTQLTAITVCTLLALIGGMYIPQASPTSRGEQPLAPRMEGSVKMFDLDASVIRWNILPWKTMTAYAINRQVWSASRVHRRALHRRGARWRHIISVRTVRRRRDQRRARPAIRCHLAGA